MYREKIRPITSRDVKADSQVPNGEQQLQKLWVHCFKSAIVGLGQNVELDGADKQPKAARNERCGAKMRKAQLNR